MPNPFDSRDADLAGPATDIVPVTPHDVTEFPNVAIALYVEQAGALSILTEAGNARLVQVVDNSFLPVAVRRVNATGTTASGIHALVLA